MIHKGQIVEIPADAPVYRKTPPPFSSKREELQWMLPKTDYSLFDGFLVGEHQGAEHFIVGQRKGLNVGGKKEPLYVIATDLKNNRVFVGQGEAHPALWSRVLCFPEDAVHWFQNTDLNDEQGKGINVEVRSAGSTIPAVLYIFDGYLYLEFPEKVSVALQEQPMDIYDHQKILADINKQKLNN